MIEWYVIESDNAFVREVSHHQIGSMHEKLQQVAKELGKSFWEAASLLFKKGVVINLAKFTGKTLWQSLLFLLKLQVWVFNFC